MTEPTRDEEIEAWLSADERFPPSADEKALQRWKARNWSKLLPGEPESPPSDTHGGEQTVSTD